MAQCHVSSDHRLQGAPSTDPVNNRVGRLIFSKAAMKVDRNPFPINMVAISASSKGKGLAGPSDRPEKTQTDRCLIEEEVARRRGFRPTSRHLAAMYSGHYWKGVRREQRMAADA